MANLKKHILFPLISMLALACTTLYIHEVPVSEIVLPDAPEKVELPFRGVDEMQIEEVLAAMTLEEKIGQCILWQPEMSGFVNRPEAFRVVADGRVGGLLFRGLEVGAFAELTDSLRQISPLPLFHATDEKVSLHGQFAGLPSFPQPISIAAIDSAALKNILEKHYLEQCAALGINLSFRPTLSGNLHEADALTNYLRTQREIKKLTQQNIIAAATGFAQMEWPAQDSTASEKLRPYHLHTRPGLPGLMVDNAVFDDEKINLWGREPLSQYFPNILNFNGLAFAKIEEGESPSAKILAGADQLITADAEKATRVFHQLLQNGDLSERSIDQRVRRILTAKSWLHGGRLPVEIEDEMPLAHTVSFPKKTTSRLRKISGTEKRISAEEVEELRCYFEHPAWSYFSQTLFEKSVTLASNHGRTLPFRNLLEKQFTIFEYNGKSFPAFEKNFAKYADFDLVRHQKLLLGGLPKVQMDDAPDGQPVAIVLLDGLLLHPETDGRFAGELNRLSQTSEVVVVNFGYPENLGLFGENVAKLQIYERNKFTEEYVAQALFGGVEVGGKLPMTVSADLPISTSEHIYKMRLSFGTPERNGIATERLVGINAIAETAIDNRVFPGCQVAIAKDGNVIFSQGFGHHTYSEKQPVKTDDLYDIASVTKVASTTLALMKLAGQQSINVQERLNKYVPEAKNTTVGNIRLKDLLIHRSNLQAPMPIGKYFNYRNVPAEGCNDIFCVDSTENYNVKLSPKLYFRGDHRDSIWQNVFNLKLLPKRKSYRYSDVNFYLLQKVVEAQSHRDLESYVQDYFYRPLGLRYMTYNPSQRFDLQQIAPTERDLRWRHSLVHGIVHDPSAALMGGVGGNAGLFANAEDMTVLFQMLLEDGIYGGMQYLESGMVKEFTTPKYGNFRGLGFDKPIQRRTPTYSLKTSSTGYGHTGFTGTCTWVDPENGLVYVFLSNRIHPSSANKKIFTENVRSRIHEVVYYAFDSFEKELPELGGE